jgi:putative hydrolase of the HAD superfamily
VIRWVLFDAVGTLIYPDPPVAEVYHAAAREFGSRLTAHDLGPRFRTALASEQAGRPADPSTLNRPPTSEALERERWQRIVRQVIDDVEGEAQRLLFERLWQHFALPEHWRLFEDVKPTLSELAARDFRLGIASNFDGRLHSIIAGHRPLQNCQAVFVSSEVGFAKPDPRFFAAITAHLGVPPHQVLLVGDDPLTDISAGSNFGWQTVFLDRRHAEPSPATIHSLTSLSSFAWPDF